MLRLPGAMLRVRKQGFVQVGTLAVLAAAVSSGGCGKATKMNPDGGDGVVTTTPDGLPGLQSFDVVAVLRSTGTTTLPQALSTSSFTMVIDVDAGLAIVGANGSGAVVGLTSTDRWTFRSTGPFEAARAGTACGAGLDDVIFETIEVTIAGGSLTGSAQGTALIPCGDCAIPVVFTAFLTGTSDVTPPALRGFSSLPTSPFDGFRLVTSEPLPATATARLIADDGAVIDLVPQIIPGDVPILVSFTKPELLLRAGHAYSISLDGLVDFAGHADLSGLPLRLASFTAAPTVPADGFESATGNVLGGAMVMTAGPLPAIAGNTSLYIGAANVPALDSPTGRSLMVRLSRRAGETKVRLSYRTVAGQASTGFSGWLRAGSEGATPGPFEHWLGTAPGSTAEMLTVAGQTVYASPVASKEVMLPADVTDEVLVWITPSVSTCISFAPASAGLLIDDLRLE